MPPRQTKFDFPDTHAGKITAFCIGNRSGKVFATGGDDGMVYLWSIFETEPKVSIGPFFHSISICKFDRSEEFLLLGTSGGKICVVDIDKEVYIFEDQLESVSITCGLFLNRLSNIIAVGDSKGKVSVYNTTNHSLLKQIIAHIGPVNDIQIYPQGNALGSCGNDKTIKLYDIYNYDPVGVIRSFTDSVLCLAFHPYEKFLASCSADMSISIYDLSRSLQISNCYMIGKSTPSSMCFSNDGGCIAISSNCAFSVYQASDTAFSDHYPFESNDIQTMALFSTGISFIKCFDNVLSYIMFKSEDFPVLRRKKEVEKPKPSPAPYQFINREKSVPVHIFDPGALPTEKPIPARKMQAHLNAKFLAEIQLNKKPIPTEVKDPGLYKAFKNDRTTYLNMLATRLANVNRIRDIIKQKGTDTALAEIASTGESTSEIIGLLHGRSDSIRLDNAESLLKISKNALSNGDKTVITLIKDVIDFVAPLVRIALTEPKSIAILGAAHGLSSYIKEIAGEDTHWSQDAKELISNFSEFFN